jgi:hypothetical protein
MEQSPSWEAKTSWATQDTRYSNNSLENMQISLNIKYTTYIVTVWVQYTARWRQNASVLKEVVRGACCNHCALNGQDNQPNCQDRGFNKQKAPQECEYPCPEREVQATIAAGCVRKLQHIEA